MIRRFAAVAALLFALPCFAQSPAPLARPDLEMKVSGRVLALARTPDGGLVVGGEFASVNGVPRANLARLRADGSVDPAWNPGADDRVHALAVAPDGAVYAAGLFTRAGGVQRAGLAKLSAQDGSAVAAWRSPLEPSAGLHRKGVMIAVHAIAVDADGAVYIGGDFPFGEDFRHLARLDADSGAPDPAWAGAPDPVNAVLALAVDDEAVYAGGVFDSVGETPRFHLAKFARGTGELAAGFAPEVDYIVYALALRGGTLYLGGEFNAIGDQNVDFLARIATADGAFDAGWMPEPDGPVYALALAADEAIHVGGEFTQVGGAGRRDLAKLSTQDGAAVVDWTTHAEDDWGAVEALAPAGTNGERLAVGGRFAHIGGETRLGLALLGANGTVGARSDAEVPGRVNAVVRQADGGLVVGGDFQAVDGLSRANLLRLRPDGSLDPDWRVDADGSVEALASDSTGRIYAGGNFLTLGGEAVPMLGRISADGSVDAQWAPAPDGQIAALAVDGDDRVYVGGGYNKLAGAPRFKLSRFKADGVLDNWAPTYSETIYALGIDATHLYIGGYGDMFRIAFDATQTDNSWVVDIPGRFERVLAIAVAGSQVYVGGDFTNIGGQPRNGLARLSTSAGAAVDTAWNPGSPGATVWALLPAAEAVYAGGSFDTLGGAPRLNLAKLASDTGAAEPWDPQPLGFVRMLAALDDGSVLAGGDFTHVGETPRDALAALPPIVLQIFADGFED